MKTIEQGWLYGFEEYWEIKRRERLDIFVLYFELASALYKEIVKYQFVPRALP